MFPPVFQQDRHCTCKRNIVELSCNHCCSGKAITITFCESVCVCVCILSYPTCNARAPYCHLWPAPLKKKFYVNP